MPEDNIDERPNALLTKKDREWLFADEPLYTGDSAAQQRYRRRSSIKERVRASLKDFQLLVDELPEEEREKIFAAADDPRTDKHQELKADVSAAIEFLYTGMGGESGFRQPLEWAVGNGEYTLDKAETAFDVAPRFAVDTTHPPDTRGVLDAVENEQWSRLSTPQALLSFIKLARRSGDIKFDKMREQLDREEDFADADLGDYAYDPDDKDS